MQCGPIRAGEDTESRPTRGVPRVAALCPCRSVSILVFLAGGIQKRNGRQEAGAALPFLRKGSERDSNTSGASPYKIL